MRLIGQSYRHEILNGIWIDPAKFERYQAEAFDLPALSCGSIIGDDVLQ